jgi:uncharacterized lipoprotein NlpE involved in copper resistance
MSKSNFLKIFFLILLLNAACNDDANINSAGPVAPNMKEMYQKEGKWEGRYLASLPCVDCDELITMLQLNEDLSYTLKFSYKGESKEIKEFQGFFHWIEEGELLKIGDPVLGEKVNYFKIVPNGLKQQPSKAVMPFQPFTFRNLKKILYFINSL